MQYLLVAPLVNWLNLNICIPSYLRTPEEDWSKRGKPASDIHFAEANAFITICLLKSIVSISTDFDKVIADILFRLTWQWDNLCMLSGRELNSALRKLSSYLWTMSFLLQVSSLQVHLHYLEFKLILLPSQMALGLVLYNHLISLSFEFI